MSNNPPSTSASTAAPVPQKYPYAVLGGLVLAAMASIIALAVLGVSGPGFFSFTLGAAFWAMGSALLVLTGASMFLYFTLRSTSRLLAKHELELAAVRERVQDGRLNSLEGSRTGASAGAAIQDGRLTSLEVSRTTGAPGTANHDGRLTSLENSRHGSSAGAVAQDGRLASLEDAHTGATTTSVAMQAEITRLESRITSLENPRAATARTVPVIVPVGATRRANVFGDVYAVIDVEGIGPVYADVLNAAGIYNTRQLWEADVEAVATLAKVHTATVSKWQQMSELMAVKGIATQYAELLVRSGVRTIAELRAENEADLLARVTKVQDGLETRIQGNDMGLARVSGWIRAAVAHAAVPTGRAFSGVAPTIK